MKVDARLFILVLLLLASTYFIASPYISRSGGVFVSAIAEEGRCTLKVGDVISSVGGHQVQTKEDFYMSLKDFKKGEYVAMVVNNGPGGCNVLEDGYIGVNVSDAHAKRLMFGIDIQGGVTAVLSPTENPERIVKILERRAAIFGIPEFRVSLNDSNIIFTTLSETYVRPLLEPCKIETTIIEAVDTSVGTGYLPVGEGVYPVELENETITVSNKSYKINESFNLDGIEFKIRNVTNSSVVFEAKVFDNKDVLRVLSTGTFQYDAVRKVYEFTVPVEISSDASEKFYKVLKNAPTFAIAGRTYVEGFLVYYLDGKAVSQLNIPSDLASQNVSQLSIVGFSESMSEATTNKVKVIAGSETGILPNVEILGFEKYEPELKDFSVFLVAIFLATCMFVLSLIFGVRYRKIIVGLFVAVLLLANVFVVLGAVAFVQQVFGAWVIGMQTILGILFFTLAGTVQITLNAEATLRKKYFMLFGGKASANSLLDILVFSVCFLLIFTSFRFAGLTALIGLLINYALIRPICTKMF